MFEWLLTSLSLAGTWYNIQKKIAGWLIWSCANIGWVASFASKKMWAESTLFFIYFILSVYGFFRWRRQESQMKAESTSLPPSP